MCSPCIVCILPSLHQVAVIFAIAIHNILVFIRVCVPFFLYNSILKGDSVCACLFDQQISEHDSQCIRNGRIGGLEDHHFEVRRLSPSKRSQCWSSYKTGLIIHTSFLYVQCTKKLLTHTPFRPNSQQQY